MIVYLNPLAGRSTAACRWRRLAPVIRSQSGDFRLVVLESGLDVTDHVRDAAARGETRFVAAGGDGTVNRVASALLACGAATGAACLGAIGLGSSNDFHKPRRVMLQGVPVRLDFDAALPCDVLRLETDDGRPRFAVITASLGVTADANERFNRLSGWRARVKERWPNGAVLATAARAIAGFRPAPLRIDGAGAAPVANLAVLLTPFCAGSLSYGNRLAPPPGHATVALCGAMSRAELLRVLAGLARGRFAGRPGARSWQARRLDVEAERPVAIEYDGEVCRAARVSFRVLPGALTCCG